MTATSTLNPWMSDTDLFDPSRDAIGINPMYGFLDVQPWASLEDCARAGELLAQFGGTLESVTRLDNGVTRYHFPPDMRYWQHRGFAR